MNTTTSASRTASICAVLLAFGASSGAASAANANFQGLCGFNPSGTYTCSFDGLRPAANPSSCPGSFIWKYSWDFGDGSGAFTGSRLVTHTYAAGLSPTVTLTVICANGDTPQRVRFVCPYFGVPGCINVNGTWN
jgi:PKD domain